MKPFKEKFKRIETKYILSEAQLAACREVFEVYMEDNEYAFSTIANLYYDTPTFQMIRRSLEKPAYKEKLRLRSYQSQTRDQDQVFIEVKKKFQKVVYKRRLSTQLNQAELFLDQRQVGDLANQQVTEEIKWLQSRYQDLMPKIYIYYEREALQAKDDTELRITLDHHLIYRDYDLSLKRSNYGLPLLPEQTYLMEIKAAGAYPIWLSQLLNQLQIRKTSFSKYGNAYRLVKQQGGIRYA